MIKNQIKHPTLHNNHLDKTILEEIVNFYIHRTQPTTLYKVRAHVNIIGNDETDTLAKESTLKEHSNASQPHEFAHSTLYYYQREFGNNPLDSLDNGRQWEQPLTKDLLDSLKKISQNMIRI